MHPRYSPLAIIAASSFSPPSPAATECTVYLPRREMTLKPIFQLWIRQLFYNFIFFLPKGCTIIRISCFFNTLIGDFLKVSFLCAAIGGGRGRHHSRLRRFCLQYPTPPYRRSMQFPPLIKHGRKKREEKKRRRDDLLFPELHNRQKKKERNAPPPCNFPFFSVRASFMPQGRTFKALFFLLFPLPSLGALWKKEGGNIRPRPMQHGWAYLPLLNPSVRTCSQSFPLCPFLLF